MLDLTAIAHSLHREEVDLLRRLRALRRERRSGTGPGAVSLGDRVSDMVAATVGSWRFIIIQSGLLVLWMLANVFGAYEHWDPYPFILLNLVLSFQAAYTAPIIMMSQNRQSEVDRRAAAHDYEVNLKAEIEIELLHQKLDLLRDQEIATLTATVKALVDQLGVARQQAQPVPPEA